MGKGWPKVACPFRTLVVLYRVLAIFTQYKIRWLMFLHISTPLRRFCPGTIFTKKTTYPGPPLYRIYILRIICRGVPGLAIDYPCGVMGSWMTTCLPYDGRLLGLGFNFCHFVWRFEMASLSSQIVILSNIFFILSTNIFHKHSLSSFLLYVYVYIYNLIPQPINLSHPHPAHTDWVKEWSQFGRWNDPGMITKWYGTSTANSHRQDGVSWQ